MQLLTVDRRLCTQCGLCAAACPRGLIQLSPEWPTTDTHAGLCIACGQCVAVCPVKALDNSRAPLTGQVPLENGSLLSGATASQYLRSRRSMRGYKPLPVSREKLRELMDIARFAPSGGNSQGTSYHVIDRPDTLSALTEQTIAWMESPAQESSPAAKVYAQYASLYRNDSIDSILRGAPVLVLGLSDENFPRGRENTLLSFAYVELYAPTIGLGTCWAGLLEAAVFSCFSPLLDLLEVPAGKKLTGALMAGYPNYGFRRLPDRHPLTITFQGN